MSTTTNWRNTDQRWGLLAQSLHWAMFLLIIGAWFAFESMEELPKGDPAKGQWMALHKSLGATIFFLVWFRIAARFSQPTPVGIGTDMQQKLAKFAHLALYAFLIAMPITGMLASQLFGKPVSWFGLFDLPTLVGENRELAEDIGEVHGNLFVGLSVLIGLHAVAGLYHHVKLKDDVLKRMLPW